MRGIWLVTFLHLSIHSQFVTVAWKSGGVTFERIISSEASLQSGVPIDYRYNETGSGYYMPSEDGLPSVPGCPKSDEGYPWVYYGNPVKCYLAGQKGPCRYDYEKLFVKDRNPYGFCACSCLEWTPQPHDKTSSRFCSSFPDEFVYLPKSEKCYMLSNPYVQGPCKDDEWLVKVQVQGRSPEARCERRKCSWGLIPSKHNPGECIPPTIWAGSLAAPLRQNECASAGMKYSRLLKQCIPKFNFRL